jgi:cell division protein FtsL
MTAGAFPGTAARPLRRTRRTRPVVRPLVIFILAVTLAFFAVIYSRISLDRTAFELQLLEREIAAEEELHWDLRAEHARLLAPDRVTQRAAELGLVYPDDRQPIEVAGVERGIGDPEDRLTDFRALFMEQP